MSALRSRIVLVVVLSLAFLGGLVSPTTAQDATPVAGGDVTVLPPDESYAGVTRAEWDTRTWQWHVSLPEAVSPSFDPTGERCGYGQHGPVFFLINPIGQTCVVPEGTAIFVGVIAWACSTVEPPPYFGRNEEELRACSAAWADLVVEGEATINGQPVPDLENYRTSSPLFTLNFGADNLYGAPEAVALSVSEGYSFIIAPPPPGEYEITVSVRFEDEPEPVASTYRVIVEAPQVIEPAATPEGGTPVATPTS